MPESVTDRPTKAHEYLFLLSKSPRYVYDATAIAETVTEDREPSRKAKVSGAGHLALRPNGTPYDGTGTHRNRRSVWTVATQPYAGAHFATFPPKLIEPCILAGTPPKCCGVCGAPWRRVVERMAVPADVGETAGAYSQDGNGVPRTSMGIGKSRQYYREQGLEGPPPPRTVGWESTCDHQDDTGTSVVLDPFAGAGTTGVVARQLGRDFVGIELNPDYAEMARQRIMVEGRPGFDRSRHEPDRADEGQLSFLEND